VRGEFNGFSLAHPMTRVGDEFIAFVPGAAAGDAYKYFFGATSTWSTDAFAKRLDPANFNNSIVVDPEGYDWSTGPFTPPAFQEMVCYQLHVGTFSGLNDPNGSAPFPSRFVDVAARADHLAELGVNVVYLNPIHEWPGANSGGYNPAHYTAIESSLGTPEDCKAMVDALHARGIAVILDVVYNHFDAGANLLYGYTGPSSADNVFFDTPPADTPWGPQLDLDDARVRQFVLDAATLMLEEYRFDGFRVDALSAFSFGPQPLGSNILLRDLNDLVDVRWAEKLMLGEVFGDDPFFTRPTASGGLGFDSQYHTAFKDAVRNATFDAPFTSPNVGALAFAATRGGELSGVRVFDYFELHDDTWPLNGNQRAVRTIDPSAPHDDAFAVARTKLAHAITLLAKGIPCVLMGTEWLEDNDWEFQKIDWSHRTEYAEIFDFYADVIALRTGRDALFADANALGFHTNETADVFAFERSRPGGDSFCVLANLGNASFAGSGGYRIGLPRAGTWEVVVQSEARRYGGSGTGTQGVIHSEPSPLHGFAQSARFDLPARSLIVLEHRGDPGLVGLSAASETISLIQGGSQELSLEAGPAAAGKLHYLLGSLSGSAPGVPLAGLGVLPLNVDNYLLSTLNNPNAGALVNSVGAFAADGTAGAALALGPLSPFSLVGIVARHAYVVIDAGQLTLTGVSNALELELTF
jgi:1,4-alpha-glucan branching enzyme